MESVIHDTGACHTDGAQLAVGSHRERLCFQQLSIALISLIIWHHNSANIKAQLLQPLLFLVLLIFTLMYQPRGVTSLAYMDIILCWKLKTLLTETIWRIY